MTDQQYEHVEKQLIAVIDIIVYAIEKQKATPEEVAALPQIAFALSKIAEV